MPEAQLNLAQAAIHLATAPKSNASAQAIWTARREVEEGRPLEIPQHLRDAHYPGAQALGHGLGYSNPHDDPETAAVQFYLPESLLGSVWYSPSNVGFESVIRTRMESVRADREDSNPGNHRQKANRGHEMEQG